MYGTPAREWFRTYGTRCSGDRIPCMRVEGVEELLKRTPYEEAREAKSGAFIDKLVKELEQSGWFKNLGR